MRVIPTMPGYSTANTKSVKKNNSSAVFGMRFVLEPDGIEKTEQVFNRMFPNFNLNAINNDASIKNLKSITKEDIIAKIVGFKDQTGQEVMAISGNVKSTKGEIHGLIFVPSEDKMPAAVDVFTIIADDLQLMTNKSLRAKKEEYEKKFVDICKEIENLIILPGWNKDFSHNNINQAANERALSIAKESDRVNKFLNIFREPKYRAVMLVDKKGKFTGLVN